LKDSEIARALDIPARTLANWKIADDWRLKLYTYLAIKTPEELAPDVERVENILKARAAAKK